MGANAPPKWLEALSSTSIWQLLFDDAPIPMVVFAADGTLTQVNGTFADLLGYREEDLVRKDIAEISVAEDFAAHVDARNNAVSSGGGLVSVEKRFVRADGRVTHSRMFLRMVQGEDAPMILGVLVDETERKDVERRLRYEAFHDRMTGLPNRALFLDRLGQSLLRDAAGGVVVVGLDRMRSINETFGHTVGDRLVVEVGRRLVAAVGRGDTVARIGGDEFALLITSWDDTTLDVVNAAARPTLTPDGRELSVTASVGVRSLAGLEAPELVLGDALLALQRAKELGRNRVVQYDPLLRGRASRVAEIARNLRDAIARREIDVDFQPIHRADTVELSGFEALVRWRKSHLGAVPPSEFVPIAEERGLIQLIGAYVLGESLAQLAKWRERPRTDHLTMSVNLSPVQVRDAAHMELLKQLILDADVPPEKVKVEITESVFVDLTSEIAQSLIDLRSVGVQLVLDDFGTGYSSLNHLQALPFDGLKVDRSFVVRAMEDARSRNLVRSIANLARGLEMHSVAEGVELPEQRDFLTDVGFDFLQGFFFGKPMSAKAVEELLGGAGRAASPEGP